MKFKSKQRLLGYNNSNIDDLPRSQKRGSSGLKSVWKMDITNLKRFG